MEYRLKNKNDFDKLFKKGKRSFSKSLVLLYSPSKELKFGMSVSKKHGHAVVRNRIKRIIRAAFRSLIKDVKGTYHIVFLPKVAEKYSYNEILKDMKYVLAKEKLINDKKVADSHNKIL